MRQSLHVRENHTVYMQTCFIRASLQCKPQHHEFVTLPRRMSRITPKCGRAAVDNAAQDFKQLTDSVVSLRFVDDLAVPRTALSCNDSSTYSLYLAPFREPCRWCIFNSWALRTSYRDAVSSTDAEVPTGLEEDVLNCTPYERPQSHELACDSYRCTCLPETLKGLR